MKLLPPKNYRYVVPRCCATCKHMNTLETEDRFGHTEYHYECERDERINFEGADLEGLYLAVCDRYTILPEHKLGI